MYIQRGQGMLIQCLYHGCLNGSLTLLKAAQRLWVPTFGVCCKPLTLRVSEGLPGLLKTAETRQLYEARVDSCLAGGGQVILHASQANIYMYDESAVYTVDHVFSGWRSRRGKVAFQALCSPNASLSVRHLSKHFQRIWIVNMLHSNVWKARH